MANSSFSYVHPCDSSFSYSNKTAGSEQNETDVKNIATENQQIAKNQTHHSLFNEMVNLYDYQPILSKDSSGIDSSSSTTTPTDHYSPSKLSQASRSVPSSRRNSNEKDNNSSSKQSLESLFNSKLHMGTSNHNMPSIPDSSNFFSADGSFGKSTQHPSLSTTDGLPRHPYQQLSSPTDISSTTTSDTMLSSFAFDHDNSGANPIFQQSPHLSQNQSVYQHQSSSFVPPNDYGDLFSVQKTSTRHNKSLESLRSKSWTQYHDRPITHGATLYGAVNNETSDATTLSSYEDYTSSTTNNNNQSSGHRLTTANAFYNPPPPPRRSSYGWQSSDSNRHPGFPPDLSDIKNRLTTSQSHSDLRAIHAGVPQQVGSSSAASFGFYNGPTDLPELNDPFLENNNKEQQLPPLCQYYIQYGHCALGDRCQFFHPMLPSNNTKDSTGAASTPLLQHHSPITHPHTLGPHPALCPSYPMNALFNPSTAALLNNSGAGTAANGTTALPLPLFPVGASSSVYGRTNVALPFYPSHPTPLQQQPMHKQHQQGQSSFQPLRRPSTATDQDSSRFMNAGLDDFKGHIYELAKDQNGCRFLQRKIEDGSKDSTQAITMIYEEIHRHFVELMTNSFGNYLCQKLLERCNNDQRNKIVEIVAPEIVPISLNMHGTRAVQKLIEYLETPDQIQAITTALNLNVVPLIKDLNGNHVIQKCLHRLSAEHRQFIYDAVSEKCVEVATHKHGCCVLQRCIDYASDSQEAQLVKEITRFALPLVQDPYGNYVVQYVLELGNPQFSDGLIQQFLGHASYLSAQKFSSNVIEKCIRVASPETRRLLIAEFIDPSAMEKLLRDSFANYVIQTSLDYAEPNQRIELVECIRPLLASVRTTPYGKRIYSKIFRDQ